MLITIGHEIASKRIADLFVSAFEGASGYWLRSSYHVMREKMGTEKPWYADPVMYSGRFQIAITFDDPKKAEGNGAANTIITEEDVAKAFALMATTNPGHFGDFLNEDDDADTADVFMQLLVLGDVVYG